MPCLHHLPQRTCILFRGQINNYNPRTEYVSYKLVHGHTSIRRLKMCFVKNRPVYKTKILEENPKYFFFFFFFGRVAHWFIFRESEHWHKLICHCHLLLQNTILSYSPFNKCSAKLSFTLLTFVTLSLAEHKRQV